MNGIKGIKSPMLSDEDLNLVSGGCNAATGYCVACRFAGRLTADLRCPRCGADCRPGAGARAGKPGLQTL